VEFLLSDTHMWKDWVDRNRSVIFFALGGIGGITQAWTARGAFSPDLLNYLALARTLLRDGWTSAANGFWSPFYSWLLALPMYLHMVKPHNELYWVHALNLGIFFVSMLCFHVFLSHALRLAALKAGNISSWLRIETWWYFAACSLFLCAVFSWLPNALGTPDLLIASFIFLAAGYVAAIVSSDRSWPNYVLLGASLAMGYLSKAPGFPIALVFFAMLPFISWREEWSWVKCLIAVLVFALVAGPFLYTLSKKEGHLTFGESGRVASLIYVNGLPPYWLGERIGDRPGPDELVCNKPDVLMFASSPRGTFLPSYAPSVWYAGLFPRPQIKRELQNIRAGVHTLAEMVVTETDLILGLLVLLSFAGAVQTFRSVAQWWFFWFPAIAGTSMFLAVHLEERFVAPFIVLAAVGIFAGVLQANARKSRLAVHVLWAIIALQSGRAAVEAFKGLFGSPVSSQTTAARIVYDLDHNGVPPGSKIALVGFLAGPYWEWMGQYSIVGEIPSSNIAEFLGTPKADRERVYSCLASTGAQAAIIYSDSPQLLDPGWQSVGPDELYVRLLSPRSSNSAK